MESVAWLAPQSEVTNPLKPSSPRSMPVSVAALPHACGPGPVGPAAVDAITLTVLYEHMIDATPALMASSNGCR